MSKKPAVIVAVFDGFVDVSISSDDVDVVLIDYDNAKYGDYGDNFEELSDGYYLMDMSIGKNDLPDPAIVSHGRGMAASFGEHVRYEVDNLIKKMQEMQKNATHQNSKAEEARS